MSRKAIQKPLGTSPAPSAGEEYFALHLKAHGLKYDREVRLIPGRKWRWDFLVQDVAVEIHGQIWRKGGHSSGAGITRDCQKLNAATLAGYRVLVFTTEMVKSGEAIETVLRAIR